MRPVFCLVLLETDPGVLGRWSLIIVVGRLLFPLRSPAANTWSGLRLLPCTLFLLCVISLKWTDDGWHHSIWKQLYPECAQIQITNGGSRQPTSAELVTLPGGYSNSDPGREFYLRVCIGESDMIYVIQWLSTSIHKRLRLSTYQI